MKVYFSDLKVRAKILDSAPWVGPFMVRDNDIAPGMVLVDSGDGSKVSIDFGATAPRGMQSQCGSAEACTGDCNYVDLPRGIQ